MALDKNAMELELMSTGVLPETAKLAVSQYISIKSIDPLYAGEYAKRIRDEVTGAYTRILAKYLDMYTDENGDITNDDYKYAEDLTSSYISRNMDFIIADFRQRYTEDIALDSTGKPINLNEQINYGTYEPVDYSPAAGIRVKDYTDKMRKQVAELYKQKETPKQQTRDVEQRSTTQKQPTTRSFEQQLQRRIKSNIHEQIKDRTKVSLRDQVKQRMNKPIHQQMKEQTSKTIHQQMRSNARSASNKAFASKAKSAVTKAKASATKAKAVAKQTVSKGKAAAKAIINLVKLFLK